MLYFHKELKEKLKSDYQIQKAVSNKEYFKIENGLYSDKEFVNPLEIICKKYPEAIFTSDSAHYYYDLTDVIPDYFYLATKRTDTRINDKNIKQIFIPNELFEFGKTQIEIENIAINIYDEERILVELIISITLSSNDSKLKQYSSCLISKLLCTPISIFADNEKLFLSFRITLTRLPL